MYAELSIVITSIRSIFLLFLWQSSAIGEGGFNNSLRDSRKIFFEFVSAIRTIGATNCQSADNST
ncbi:hypothetical protein M124_3995 [Bacteroides fragilis str. 3988T(B)14]|uniref:Uncharacterized protein n=1 Tax=Bacteroides fragilis str. 3988T(B)14 TaxID=1339315 RepID=A0A015UTK2_BACFG|nr:hypothetical protein M124_3995 [Bacteroides fragilis str. 3988T(B)14]RGY72183.1 hypothetical protein DXA26_16510 [Bacteroides fragilis]